ncbi:DUF1987 domain-containing protein [Reichenbachiella carrageenanivorans]|uniref:DUF1987 domain-containing protein n=1 Tax=Reichenbachiella carrageenanivorans TaxID=2979869 RepID=A0ABY6CZU8_9BACT|nr:DUF1987 domain-containing protein [Reichenbachiella carrageenanivorans]UXX78964.1 DUF1987 domain-containing protein [Reichenbachiella carrageenanivorans]
MSLVMDGVIAISGNENINVSLDQSRFRNYVIKATASTPFVALEMSNRSLLIKGVSNPQNPVDFYDKIDKMLAYYLVEGSNSISVNFSLDYFNTGSARCLYLLMAQLREFKENGMSVQANWYYKIDDEDMLLSGKNFSSYSQLELKLQPTSPMKYY